MKCLVTINFENGSEMKLYKEYKSVTTGSKGARAIANRIERETGNEWKDISVCRMEWGQYESL